MDKNLEKLQKVFDLIETDRASTEEVAQIFTMVFEAIKKLQETHAESMSAMKRDMTESEREMAREMAEVSSQVENMEKMCEKMMQSYGEEQEKMKQEMVEEIEEVMEIMPEMPDLSQLERRIGDVEKKEIPEIPENLVNEERLMTEIEELEKKLEEKMSKLPTRVIGGASRRVFQPKIDRFTAQTDGVTKIFYLSREPLATDTIEVSGTDFPIILDPTVDFTVSGKTLTLSASVPAPSQGATLIVKYYA